MTSAPTPESDKIASPPTSPTSQPPPKPRHLALTMAALQVLLTGIVAVFAGVATYNQWQNDKVLQLQERWTSPEMQARRERLVDAQLCKEFTTNSSVVEDILNAIILPSEGYSGVTTDLPAFQDFFEDAKMCLDTRVCDPVALCRRFSPIAEDIRYNFSTYIRRSRTLFNDQQFGNEFEALVDACKPFIQDISPAELQDINPDETSVTGVASPSYNEPSYDELRDEFLDSNTPLYLEREAACARLRPDPSLVRSTGVAG
jgi:hypothetical protein